MAKQQGSGVRARKTAARSLALVSKGRSLPDALIETDAGQLAPRDRAFVRRLAAGVLRHRRRLHVLLNTLVSRPLTSPFVENLLLIGLYELEIDRDNAHGSVHSAVEAAPEPMRGLVNAVLRRFLREGAQLPKDADAALLHSYPRWLAAELQTDWPELGPDILAAGNEEPPLVLRVNRRQCSPRDYAQELSQAGITCRPAPGGALVLDRSLPLNQLPGFESGRVSVQGLAAQHCVPLLDVQPGQRVLDACAAPGGKAAQILEQTDPGEVVALDSDAQRLDLCRMTLDRLGLEATLEVADAGDPDRWWDGRPFDRILLDAPCSGTGVIRRHPDIKWLRRGEDIEPMMEAQLRMLRALWSLLAPGGVLLYTTCSILSRENDGVVARALETFGDSASLERPQLPEGEASELGWRIPPHGAWEGFYYARLRRGR